MGTGALLRLFFFFSSRRRHTRSLRDWSSDVCSSDLVDDRRQRLGAALRPLQQLAEVPEEDDEQHPGQGAHHGGAEDGRAVGGDVVQDLRSEERRVGKECRSRWSRYGERKEYGERVVN